MLKIFKESKRNKKLWQLIGLIFLVGALVSGLVLVKQSQDIRERANTVCFPDGNNCKTSNGCDGTCQDNACVPQDASCDIGTKVCFPDGNNCKTSNGCDGTCQDDACVPQDASCGTDDEDNPTPCTDDSQCPNDRHCQNGKCLSAGGGAGIFGRKCDEENSCSGGKKCSTTIGRCMSKANCKRFGKILKCE